MILTDSCIIENPTNDDILEIIQKSIDTIRRDSVFCTHYFADTTSTHVSLSFGYKSIQDHFYNLSITLSLINASLDEIAYFKIDQKLTELERLCDV